MLWEWGGRTVSPHPHAHSTTAFDFTMEGKPSRTLHGRRHCFPSLHDCAKGSRTSCCFVHPRAKSELFSPHVGPPLLFILTQRDSSPFFIFMHRNFWVFPRRSLPCEITAAVAIESRYLSLPLSGLYVFSQ